MKILVVIANPNPGSFSHALAEVAGEAVAANGHELVKHDLYAEKFDPILPAEEIPKDGKPDPVIKRHCDDAASADGIIVIHPNWWGQPPAILKGWVDRVLRQGVAYSFLSMDAGEGVPIGLLKANTAVVLNTSNTVVAREVTVFGDPLENLWKKCIFGLCGVHTFRRRCYGVMVTSTPEQRKEWLADARRLVSEAFPPA
jgi:putative NADPH-quinone reductase